MGIGQSKNIKPIGTSISSRTIRHRHRYEETVILFRPMIVSDVIPDQILPHLHFLSDSDKSAIRGTHDEHKAVELLLDKIATNDDPGRWKTFVQVLERCGFQTVTDALKRLHIADNSAQRETLRIFSPKLREMIKPTEITAYLCSKEVITSDDKEEIHQKERNVGAIAAADILLDRIPRKQSDWFWHFLIALREINRSDLIFMLTDDTVYEDLEHLEPKASLTCPQQSIRHDQTAESRAILERNAPNTETENNVQIRKMQQKTETSHTGELINGSFSQSNFGLQSTHFISQGGNPRKKSESFEATQLESEIEELEHEVTECKEFLKAKERKIELLHTKKALCEQIKVKEEEESKLRAGKKSMPIDECTQTEHNNRMYQSSTNLKHMDLIYERL